MKVMCAIFRPCFASPFPYQCSPAPGMLSARCISALVSAVSPSPRMLSITAAPTRRAVPPRGRSRMARRWFSNWSVSHASMV